MMKKSYVRYNTFSSLVRKGQKSAMSALFF